MKTLLPFSRAATIWSAMALISIACQPMLTPAAIAGQPVRGAAAVNPDVDHTGILRIGFNEKLPVTRHVLIGLDKSMVVELPRDLKDVVVSNPANLDAVVQTSNRVFLIAKKVGDANVFFFDENGEQVMTLEVRIEHDMTVFNRLIERLIPGSHINAEVLNDTMVLSGSVINPADAAKASDIAARFMVHPSEGPATADVKVINLLEVEAKEQVMLKVTIAEVSRELIKRLGINLAGQSIGNTGLQFGTNNNYAVSSGNGSNSFLSGVLGSNLASCLIPTAGAVQAAKLATSASNCLGYSAQAFERAGLVKTLAEPTLTAISGESAAFQAGGSFPVLNPGGTSSNGQVQPPTVTYKDFGVALSFVPLVQSEGRITLKVSTEVSELSTKGAVSIGGLTIPALTVRRANTTVELPSGGSMILGGLISDNTKQNIDGVPGLKDLPILGALFRSRDFQKEETELVVIATPYMVNAVARSKIDLPTDGLDPATDTQATLMGQLNHIYGHRERAPEGEYRGNYGFIVE